jgi:hypothetical protein
VASAVAVLLAAGCELKRSPGPKTVLLPAFKHYVVEHPVPIGARSIRSGSVELRIDRAVTEEHRTALGTDSWRTVVHAIVVNHGASPLFRTELSDAFQIVGRSGALHRGDLFTDTAAGWRSRQGTSEPNHLPPGGEGRVRISAPDASKSARDDPAALTFRGGRIDFR